MSTALITGASSGIGAEFARQLSQICDDVVLVARRADRLETVAGQLRDSGATPHVITADLVDPDAPRHIFETTQNSGLSVDFLVNNAGTSGPHLLHDRDWEDHEAFFRLMMTSVAEMCHLFIPPMRERNYGRVINVSSVAGIVSGKGSANYGPVKRYLIGLSEELHLIAREDGVHVSALCPGFTHTEFHDSDQLARMKSSTPRWLWYDADVVVRDGIKAVEKGRSVMVSGRLYRVVAPLLRTRTGHKIFARVR